MHLLSQIQLHVKRHLYPRGLCGDSGEMYKAGKENVSEAMASVFNLFLLQGIVPDILKILKVTPV